MATDSNAISSKKKIYRLRDVSYMSLSITYIFLLILLFVLLIGSTGYFLMSSQLINLFLSMPLIIAAMYFVYSTGIKYGEYGLEIMIAKAFLKRHYKNDFPVLKHRLLNTPISQKHAKKTKEKAQ